MPSTPYIISGTAKDSKGKAIADIRISFEADETGTVTTNSSGQYMIDLANFGYTAGETINYSAVDKFQNEIASGTITLSGESQTLNFSLSVRETVVMPPGNKDIQIYNIGGKPVSLKNSFPVLLTSYDGNDNEVIMMDRSTRSLCTLDYEHCEVHSGSHYLYTDAITLGNGESQAYVITAPDTAKYAHMVFIMNSGLGASSTVAEGGDRTPTTLQNTWNSNRNSSNSAGTLVHKGFSGGTTDGTTMISVNVGSASTGGKTGGGARSEEEIILKRNTQYILTLTSGANSNNITIIMTWYEHQDKS